MLSGLSCLKILESMDREESRERLARRAWALSAMDEEQRRRGSQEVKYCSGHNCLIGFRAAVPRSSLCMTRAVACGTFQEGASILLARHSRGTPSPFAGGYLMLWSHGSRREIHELLQSTPDMLTRLSNNIPCAPVSTLDPRFLVVSRDH